MLSKSQAKIFFVGGTVLFGGIFLALTYDSMLQVPKKTHAHNLTPKVIEGKELWEANNCMGCHTLFGEGAYYAPELTKVVERRGEAWIKIFIKDPQAMFPGERKMVKYDFTDDQIDAIFQFLKWCGEVDLNGFPKKPPLQTKLQSTSPVVQIIRSGTDENSIAQPEIFAQLCIACHSINGSGGNVGPALDGVHNKMDAQQMKEWLTDPLKVKPGTTMPKLPLTDTQIIDLVEYLLQGSSVAQKGGL